MGYRSEVAVAFICEKEKEHSLLKLYLDENIPEWTKEHYPLEAKPYGFKIEFESIKWYDGYDEVDEFMKFLGDFDATFTLPEAGGVAIQTVQRGLIGYQFIRIGEDNTDIVEIEGGDIYDHALTVIRTIEDY